jgi:hypothetical protein
VAGSCEHGNELSGSIKAVKFFDCLNDYWHLKKDSGPLSQSVSQSVIGVW